MRAVTATEASRRFSDVLDAVENGESLLIVRRGRAIARIQPAPSGTGRAVKDLLRRSPRDPGWLDDVRRTRATTEIEDRRWTG